MGHGYLKPIEDDESCFRVTVSIFDPNGHHIETRRYGYWHKLSTAKGVRTQIVNKPWLKLRFQGGSVSSLVEEATNTGWEIRDKTPQTLI